MKIPKFLDDLSVISKLGDNPGADNGLTAEGLKAKFDEAGLKLQTFLNETLIEKINSLFSLDAPPHEGMNMTGPINMNKNKLGGLADPAEDGDAVPLGFANKNFAPAGYGLGETHLPILDKVALDNTAKAGWYMFYDTNNPVGNVRAGLVRCSGKNNNIISHCIQELWSSDAPGCVMQRLSAGGTWGEWEWVNPPMTAGVEYRTIERYNGKPVYVKLIAFGALPNTGNKNVAFYSDETVRPISVATQVGKELDSLYMTIPAKFSGQGWWISAVNYNTIRITTEQNNSDMQARVIVKYWKSTD